MLSVFAITFILITWSPRVVQAQGGTSNATCYPPSWELNDQGENPCLVWAQLLTLCQSGPVNVQPLPNNSYYLAPGDNWQPNDCNCNIVSYNLMEACCWCQPQTTSYTWLNETTWIRGCPTYNPTGVTGVSLADVHIPAWTYEPGNGESWDPSQAQAYEAAISVSSTAAQSTSITTTSSSTSNGGSSTTTSSASSPGSSSGGQTGGSTSSSNTGAIVGGVVGGVVGLALIVLLAIFIFRRNNTTGPGFAGPGDAALGMTGKGSDRPMLQQATSFSTASPMPSGATAALYLLYQPGTTTGMGYDGSAPATSYSSSPPPGVFHGGLPAGQNYGSQLAVGGYSGLPEAGV
ncbi:hypothetical protein DACRYDRAFT_93125 [Dacryopinax primogenitus]|uniref:Mid2 domain-containing protein n=1 Tax=Dacryopinax primogenitus (strain DJM 731) TaxID=1858805 RepID=M5GDM2_DACPD|nr:uncharacterized protein DACRYDRAFT_93125 [Dacryopinax primogenitus]EJU04642.1 hypothetical protein DACRYDRAFT_93125 [Dacryopinax primogenitus]